MPYTTQEIDAYVKIRGRICGTRIFLATIVGVVMIALKAAGYTDCSWTIATAPIWGSAIYFVAAILGIGIFGLRQHQRSQKVRRASSAEASMTAATADWLQNRTDPRVQDALGRRCGVCQAKPGNDCRHPFETREPLDRVVHLARVQAA